MKVLNVIGSMNPSSGGPCQGIRNAAPEQKKRGVHNEVVSFDDPAASFVGEDAFPVHALGFGKGPWNHSAMLIPWLLENLSRFDAVIVHGLWLYHGYAVRKALEQLKQKQGKNKAPKLFVMPHGMLDPYFQKASGRKLKAIRNWAYWKLIESKVVNEADGVLFTCETELQLAREPFQPYHPKKEINVGYGVATPPAFTQTMRNSFLNQCSELQHQPYIIFLSRIHEKKGVDLLIKAYAEVACKMTKAKAESVSVADIMEGEEDISERMSILLPKLVIAGPGLDTPYGKKIQQMVAKSEELQNAVFFPGMLSGDAKWGALYGCEAFILPSHQENFGIAVVEALACAKPVMISNQINIWREIEAAGGGLVAEDTQAGTIALLEQWQLLSEKQKMEMQLNARGAYEKFFAIGPHVTRLLDAISA